jgi:hypothetical protein
MYRERRQPFSGKHVAPYSPLLKRPAGRSSRILYPLPRRLALDKNPIVSKSAHLYWPPISDKISMGVALYREEACGDTNQIG